MPKKRKKSSPDVEQVQTKKTRAKGKKMAAMNGNIDNTQNVQISNSSTNQNCQTPIIHGHLSGIQPNQSLNMQNGHLNNQFMAMNSASPVFTQFNTPVTPTNMNSQQSMDITGMLSMLIQKVDILDTKLTQLETIQSTVNGLTGKMNTLSQKISTLETKFEECERSRIFDSQLLDDINKKQKDMEILFSKMKQQERVQDRQETDMKREIIDLKCRSMRDNLLFFKLPEEKDENCEQKVLDFVEEKLGIANAKSDIKLQRAHRIGRFNKDKIRPVVAKFAFYPDRERVRKNASKLKDTPYGIAEQYPREIMETRRKLFPIMKKARDEQKDAYIYVDKLFINGKEYKTES